MKYSIHLVAIFTLLFSGCVSKKQYDELLTSRNNLQREQSRLQKVEKDCAEMQEAKTKLEAEYAALQDEKSDLQKKIDNLHSAHDALNEKYDQLLKQNSSIVNASSQEIKSLAEELGLKQSELDLKEKELNAIDTRLQRQEDELEALKMSLEDREAKIQHLTDQLNAQRAILTGLKSRLSDALLGFSDTDLTVTQKDGKVYVSMSQNLLFAKGSTVIDAAGKDAIIKVSNVLRNNPEIDIMVEGHTDSDGTADRNWDLSVDRATAVVKLMTANGVQPERVTAAGRAFYAPLVPNDNEVNKSKNRRTEIILSPRLGELQKLLNE